MVDPSTPSEATPFLVGDQDASGVSKNSQLLDNLSSLSNTTNEDAEHDKKKHHHHHHHDHSGNASVHESALNIAKTCLGTGTLALPFAASQGGYIFSTLGIAAISAWNLYCVDRMVKCKDLLPVSSSTQPNEKQGHDTSTQIGQDDGSDTDSQSYQNDNMHSSRQSLSCASGTLAMTLDLVGPNEEQLEMPEGTATFGKVVWHAIGPSGVHLFDVIMIILLFGIIIAYEGKSVKCY
jgi:hypothetical protein